MYRMAQSPYLYLGQPDTERAPIQPYASFATGANEMSPLDMASGAQTIANHGLHMAPYYVELHRPTPTARCCTRTTTRAPRCSTPASPIAAVDILKGVLTEGTARRHPLADGSPAAGKTGTQEDNTNAWFVGFTRHLTTAVWIGDPNGYTPMAERPRVRRRERVNGCRAACTRRRSGRRTWTRANQFLPIEDWAAAAAGRPAAGAPVPARQRVPLPDHRLLGQRAVTVAPTPGRVCHARSGAAAGDRADRRRRPGPTGADRAGAPRVRPGRRWHHHPAEQPRRRRTRAERAAEPGSGGTGAERRSAGAATARHALDQLGHRLTTLPERAAADAADAELRRNQARLTRLDVRLGELSAAVERAEHDGAELMKHRARLEAQLKTVSPRVRRRR